MKKKIYGREDVRRLQSDYLDRGYKEDTVEIHRVEAGRDWARALLDVPEHYLPGEGRYHFTSIHAMIVVSQVGIFLASRANDFGSKPGEIYMRDFSIVCRRKIYKTRDICMTLKLRRATRARDHVLYDVEYEFEQEAFGGTLRCLFPIRSKEAHCRA